MMMMSDKNSKLRIEQAIVVEGRDDVDAVSRACDALIIPTHGYGISAETWNVIAKAYEEKGIIILTDPDNAGGRIRRRLTERFPDAVQCYMTREDTTACGDIGIENADPDDILRALKRALELSGRSALAGNDVNKSNKQVTMEDLRRLGLAGADGSAGLRAAVARELGTGYGNAGGMLKRLRGFGIGRDELEETVRKIKKEKAQ
ncbi:MAG: DUF4093 domain-containing protein [Clostridiales bacterium]|nr:DUF4093 domain-containing protein [Clostridiales bacterium]